VERRDNVITDNQVVYKTTPIFNQSRYVDFPCHSCGRSVRVHLNSDGLYVGCIFCEDCRSGSSAGTEQFSKDREF